MLTGWRFFEPKRVYGGKALSSAEEGIAMGILGVLSRMEGLRCVNSVFEGSEMEDGLKRVGGARCFDVRGGDDGGFEDEHYYLSIVEIWLHDAARRETPRTSRDRDGRVEGWRL